jgi:hypothetical protein
MIDQNTNVLEINSGEDALIRIDALPAVEEFFSSMRDPVARRITEILSAECTEETRRDAEQARAEVRRFKADIKDALKKAEAQLYEPWNKVLERAGDITALCDHADMELKCRIDTIKVKLKKEKFDEVEAYFEEKRGVLGLDWLDFEWVAPNIRLNDSLTALRKAIDQKLDRISADVMAILAMEHSAEIMAEYKGTLDLAASMKIVKFRLEREAEEAARIAALADKKREEAERIQNVQKAAETHEEKTEQLHAPEVKSATGGTVASDTKRYNMTFTVSGTLDELKALKKWLYENNITIID